MRRFSILSGSLVDVFAVADAEDINPIAVVVKADPPVSHAKTEFGRMDGAKSPERYRRP